MKELLDQTGEFILAAGGALSVIAAVTLLALPKLSQVCGGYLGSLFG